VRTKLLLITLFFILTACDNPAAKLENYKPESFKLTFTEGGLLLVREQKYKEKDNFLSKVTANEVYTKKGELSYKAIYSFLRNNNSHYTFINYPEIPYEHVIVAYIEFTDKEKLKQKIAIGEHWLSYNVQEDWFGETSVELYKSSRENIKALLVLLYNKANRNQLNLFKIHNKLLNLTANTSHFLCVRYRSLPHKKCAALAAI